MCSFLHYTVSIKLDGVLEFVNVTIGQLLVTNFNSYLASFPGSPSFHAIIPCMTFDPPAFLSGGSKVIHGTISRKEGEQQGYSYFL